MKRLFVLSILVLSLLVQVQGTGRAEDGSPASPGNKAPSTPVGTPESVVTLARGLQLVTSESHDVLITQEGELLALADLHLARSGFFPTINGSGSHTSLEYQVAGVTNAASPIVNRQGLVVGQGTQRLVVPQVPTDYWSFSASVQQTLFDFWRTIGLYKANKEFLSNSKLDTARVKNLTALQFTTAYFDQIGRASCRERV
jgi:outer membrane protein TolC